MYKKLHYKLTLLLTSITALIMIIMSVFYIYTSENSLRTNSQLSFSSDMNTFISNLEQQTSISYEWLSKIESNGNYQIALFDNGVPLTFNSRKASSTLPNLIADIKKQCSTQLVEAPSLSSYISTHTEFTYSSTTYGDYYVCNAYVPGKDGLLEIFVCSQTPQIINQQIQNQRFVFILIDCIVVVILFLFSYFFTKKLLQPIIENQRHQTQFVASASHELRTPLAVILSSLSAIDKADCNEQKHFLTVIKSESQRMSALIQDMLTLASSDSHSLRIEEKPVELDTLMLNCYEAFQPLCREKQLLLQIELPEDMLPPCTCDAKRIQQVLMILLHNAVSYSTSGGYIKLALSARQEHFEITVSDNGIGISDMDKPHIFERFYRAQNSSSEHFGLGLCIAKEIIAAHHGSIQVTDTMGGGTTFLLILP